MPGNEVYTKDQRAFCYLGQMPRRMLKLHGNDHVTECVFYDLCHENCFNLNKAAYFVDSPDFDCLKGVSGYARTEACQLPQDFWASPALHSTALKTLPFNQQVRNVMQCSVRRGRHFDDTVAHELAEKLGLERPHYCTWDMKHDNHGILLYETSTEDVPSPDCILSGAGLLSFCPIY